MTTAIKPRPATFKHIEAELYGYHETKKEIRRLREEILSGGQRDDDDNTGAGSNSTRTPGRPTERIATRLMTDKRLRNLEEIVEAIDNIYDSVPDHYKEMINIKYWSNKNFKWSEVANECFVHPNTATKMRSEVITLIADKLGWR
ncbi:transcriptional regulator [Scopulibacillus darangshiensis]|uniref:transcriptional regulator n=1 Tax=Scopulibacillus darangshiensis TaxID=442528 RepID=UPI001FB1E63C|nr:transcriptional regulator [Scopulibacillus darangshiensis]